MDDPARRPRSRLNEHLVPIKAALETAKNELDDREWHVLRAILLIQLHAEDGQEPPEGPRRPVALPRTVIPFPSPQAR